MRILLITNPTAFPWDPRDIDSLGGGEDAIRLWSLAMTARGHQVTVLYDGPQVRLGDHGPWFAARGERLVFAGTGLDAYDVAIYRKCPELYDPRHAPVALLWTDQNRAAPFHPFRRIVLTSPYLRRVQEAAFPATRHLLDVLPDGYDPYAFPIDVARDPNLVLHASSPDRGLVELLRLWPRVVEARPDARLHISYGWELFDACGGNPALRAEVERLIEQMPRHGDMPTGVARDGAVVLGEPTVTMSRGSYADIHRLFKQAGVWAYYCTGGEGFCQTAVKAQMAGAVPVVRPWGALHDTVWSGFKVETDDAFVAAMVEALDPERQEQLRQQMMPMAPTWDTVAEAWGALLSDVTREEPRAAVSKLTYVPATPVGLVPNPALNVPGALQQLVGGWAQAVAAQRPWAEPSLGITFPPLPPGTTPDAYVVGWVLEDSPQPPALTLHGLGIPPETPVLVLTSVGAWRAQHRHRALVGHDLTELFGKMPAVQSQACALDADGNAITATAFRWNPHAMGERNLARVRSTQPARETLSVCFMAPRQFDDAVFLQALRSVQPIADQVVVALNGPTATGDAVYPTEELVTRWGRETGIPVTLVEATNPRHCFDCQRLHDVGELQPGHRVAGFETPRNQSIAVAEGDWICWQDTDERLLEPERLARYLRPNIFEGYGLQQDHFSSDPPQAFKRDTPVRVFRRRPDGKPGWIPGADWPTYHSGLTARFAGIVHEHPGHAPTYAEGLGPVLLLPDVWLAHSGYYTELMRRRRFLRNWPLMVADRAKYPDRRLGLFLWLRDLSHHVRYLLEQHRGQLVAEAVWCAEEAIAVFEAHFVGATDAFLAEASQYVDGCYRALSRGLDASVQIQVRRPEVSGEEAVAVMFQGRVGSEAHLEKLVAAGLGGCERWSGEWC